VKEELEEYLRSIGITEKVFLDKIEDICNEVSQMISEEIVDFFVVEYTKKLGEREYESLILVTENYLNGVAEFLSSEYEISFRKKDKEIAKFTIKKKDYDFKEATDKSRLEIEFFFTHSSYVMGGLYKASKQNCDHLFSYFKKYLLPNLSK